MGSIGCAYDISAAESFFATPKNDLIYRRSWQTNAEARAAIIDHIEAFYNRKRRHSTLGMLSPEEFEKMSDRRERTTIAA